MRCSHRDTELLFSVPLRLRGKNSGSKLIEEGYRRDRFLVGIRQDSFRNLFSKEAVPDPGPDAQDAEQRARRDPDTDHDPHPVERLRAG